MKPKCKLYAAASWAASSNISVDEAPRWRVFAVIARSCNRDPSKQWLEDNVIELYRLMATLRAVRQELKQRRIRRCVQCILQSILLSNVYAEYLFSDHTMQSAAAAVPRFE